MPKLSRIELRKIKNSTEKEFSELIINISRIFLLIVGISLFVLIVVKNYYKTIFDPVFFSNELYKFLLLLLLYTYAAILTNFIVQKTIKDKSQRQLFFMLIQLKKHCEIYIDLCNARIKGNIEDSEEPMKELIIINNYLNEIRMFCIDVKNKSSFNTVEEMGLVCNKIVEFISEFKSFEGFSCLATEKQNIVTNIIKYITTKI